MQRMMCTVVYSQLVHLSTLRLCAIYYDKALALVWNIESNLCILRLKCWQRAVRCTSSVMLHFSKRCMVFGHVQTVRNRKSCTMFHVIIQLDAAQEPILCYREAWVLRNAFIHTCFVTSSTFLCIPQITTKKILLSFHRWIEYLQVIGYHCRIYLFSRPSCF